MHKPKIIVEVMNSNRKRIFALIEAWDYLAEPIIEAKYPFFTYYCFKPQTAHFRQRK